jgi:hypothetical protein
MSNPKPAVVITVWNGSELEHTIEIYHRNPVRAFLRELAYLERGVKEGDPFRYLV